MAITVKGEITLRGNYEVKLNMTEDEFDNLSEQEQHDLIEGGIEWKEWLDNSDTDDIDVDEVE
jgi:hypothetical protein